MLVRFVSNQISVQLVSCPKDKSRVRSLVLRLVLKSISIRGESLQHLGEPNDGDALFLVKLLKFSPAICQNPVGNAARGVYE